MFDCRVRAVTWLTLELRHTHGLWQTLELVLIHRDVMWCVENVLREEVKEKMVWSVDRSSPSNKIRDLMKWSKDILKDIFYQRKILSSPIATFFTKQWSVLSLCYCIYLLLI